MACVNVGDRTWRAIYNMTEFTLSYVIGIQIQLKFEPTTELSGEAT